MKHLNQLLLVMFISSCGILPVVLCIINLVTHLMSHALRLESGTCLGLKDLQREIMLFPDVNRNYAVASPFRKTILLPPVTVPVYPEVKNMILVEGNNDEFWDAEVKHVLFAEKLVKGYFQH